MRLLAKEFTLHWVYLLSTLRLPLAFFVVTFLWGCSLPSLVWCFPQQQRLNQFLGLLRFSFLLCHIPLSVLISSIFVPISLFSSFYQEHTVSCEMLCCLPCISLFPFLWQKPHECLCWLHVYRFQAFLCNSSCCSRSCTGGTASAE